jgi:hypothetical protein
LKESQIAAAIDEHFQHIQERWCVCKDNNNDNNFDFLSSRLGQENVMELADFTFSICALQAFTTGQIDQC